MPDDGFRHELVRGELRSYPYNDHAHGACAGTIAAVLGQYIRDTKMGAATIAAGYLLETDPDHVRSADIAFVRRERDEAVGATAEYFPGPPDLAIEVISIWDTYSEIEEKIADLLDAGTQAMLVVDPRRRTVKVHRSVTDATVLTEADTLAIDDVVPGWEMPVREIFE